MAAGTDPIPAWDTRYLVAAETTFGTTPDAAGTQAIEAISCDMGPMEVGVVRPQRDKTQGRGMTSKFTEGGVEPIPWSMETSVKSRAAVDTVPKESVLYKAAGFVETVNASTNVSYSLNSAPTIVPVSIYRAMGAVPLVAEQGRGGTVKQLTWTAGEADLTLKASGAFMGKYHLGYVESATFADGSGTSLTLTGEDIFRVGLGWYRIESEIIKVTAMNYTSGVATVGRAALGSTGAAHTAQPLYPYIPTLTLAGSPISEANYTFGFNNQTIRATKFSIDWTSGMDHLPRESGSKRSQGIKATRYDCKSSVSLIMKRQDVALLGKALNRTSGSCAYTAGTGAGSILSWTFAYSEVEAFSFPDTANDVVACDISFRHRDNSGNDLLDFVLT